jgi:hypothetical protein
MVSGIPDSRSITPTSCFVAKEMGPPLVGLVALCTLKHVKITRRRRVVEEKLLRGA